ncbi:MAG TPA: hypothetical protein V6D19_16375 [Stenomitos sp.]
MKNEPTASVSQTSAKFANTILVNLDKAVVVTASINRIYKTPWQGEPYVNIQPKAGMAKPYQVKQVLAAIAKLEGHNGG